MKHADIWHMIPCYVNDTVSGAERERITAHLAECEDCQGEHAAQQRVAAAVAVDRDVETGADVSFERLWSRIAASEIAARDGIVPNEIAARDGIVASEPGDTPAGSAAAMLAQVPDPAARASLRTIRWLAAAVVIEAVGLATLAALGLRTAPEPPALYRTVTTPTVDNPAAIIRAVFAPELAVEDLRRLLLRSQLQIVGGPSEAGVYTLGRLVTASPSQSTSVATSLTRLRREPAVRFAEPIGAALGQHAAATADNR